MVETKRFLHIEALLSQLKKKSYRKKILTQLDQYDLYRKCSVFIKSLIYYIVNCGFFNRQYILFYSNLISHYIT